MVALVKEKVTRATRRAAMEKEKETGTTMDKDKVVLVVFKATVTTVTSWSQEERLLQAEEGQRKRRWQEPVCSSS